MTAAGEVDVANLHPQELQKLLDAVEAEPVTEAPQVPAGMQPLPTDSGLFPVGE
jgi:hypothetical protein